MADRPDYDAVTDLAGRAAMGERLATQILATCSPYLPKPVAELAVLDVGSGYGGTARALSRRCRIVTALEPSSDLHGAAVEAEDRTEAVEFVNAGVLDLDRRAEFDLVVLDNVYEHLPDQPAALRAIAASMRRGAVLYLLVPNKLWPVEAHYHLPFLSWLPLSWADRYLRWTGRGTSYLDASYAPTSWQLRRELVRAGFDVEFVLPGDPSATMAGSPWHYRAGMVLLRRFPALWALSKALLVVATKPHESRVSESRPA